MKDINENKPEIYICAGNRTAGKTVYFNSYVIRGILKKKFRKFVWLVRNKNELQDLYSQVYEPINFLFPDLNFSCGKIFERGYRPILIDEKIVGFGIALRFFEQIKKVSNLFNDVDVILWDEFQLKTVANYLPNEIDALLSIHESIARGEGKMSRYVPLICVGNAISLLAPLYSITDIPMRLKKETKFLRGNGYVLEQVFNKNAAQAQNESIFNQAVNAKEVTEFDYEDDFTSVEKIKGKAEYLCTIECDKKNYSIKRFENGIYYCSKNIDISCRKKYTIDNPREGWIRPFFLNSYRNLYNRGKFKFDSLESRNALIKLLHY